MSEVYYKDDLRNALKRGDKRIIVRGELAKKILESNCFEAQLSTLKSAPSFGGKLSSIPVVGAFALPAAAVGMAASLSVAKLATICGFGSFFGIGSFLGIVPLALMKKYLVKFTKDGSVELTKK